MQAILTWFVQKLIKYWNKMIKYIANFIAEFRSRLFTYFDLGDDYLLQITRSYCHFSKIEPDIYYKFRSIDVLELIEKFYNHGRTQNIKLKNDRLSLSKSNDGISVIFNIENRHGTDIIRFSPDLLEEIRLKITRFS